MYEGRASAGWISRPCRKTGRIRVCVCELFCVGLMCFVCYCCGDSSKSGDASGRFLRIGASPDLGGSPLAWGYFFGTNPFPGFWLSCHELVLWVIPVAWERLAIS